MITPQLETMIAGATTMLVGMAGTRVGQTLGDAVPDSLPSWLQTISGPLGGLACMGIAIWWLSQRLNKAELKAEKREDERDAERKTLIQALEQNTSAMRQVTDAIGGCKGRQ